MSYIQIDTCTWAVMRNPANHPVAVVELVPSVSGLSKFLLRRWSPAPANAPLMPPGRDSLVMIPSGRYGFSYREAR